MHIQNESLIAGMSLPFARSADKAASGRLRIMHVVNYLRRGGAELGILKLMGGLSGEDFEHRICITRKFDPDFVQGYGLGGLLDVAAGSSDNLQFPLFRLRRIFHRYRPHIVHTRNWGALEAVLAARLAGVPVVIHSEHGYEVDNMAGLPFRQRIFRKLAYSMADRVFTVTRELREYHSKQAWTLPEQISVVYNGVDTDRFSPCPEIRDSIRTELGLPPDRIVIGSVGRMVPIKDYPTLLQAAERLVARGVNLHVLLVGKGPERESLESRVRESSLLQGRVSFVGASDRVPELLNVMDIFVLPSLGEGMSNTLLEAMASGVPIVASRVGGNPEVVVGDLSEWLFTPGEAGELTERIERLAGSAETRSRIAKIGRMHALADFSLDGMIRRYRELYFGAAAERGVSITSM
jgi:sugar transferase (PEP-CTERM/EpsH1 system associated)